MVFVNINILLEKTKNRTKKNEKLICNVEIPLKSIFLSDVLALMHGGWLLPPLETQQAQTVILPIET